MTQSATTGCTDVAALTTSLHKLKTLNVQQEGLEQVNGALVEIQTEAGTAATSAANALRPEVRKVRTAVAAVQEVVRGVSADNLRENLSTISAALVQLRTAGEALTTHMSRSCPESVENLP